MKILLINPNIPLSFYNREFYLPIGLLYLGAVLKKNKNEVKILDLKIFQRKENPSMEFFDNKIIETIEDFKPDLIGWGCLYSGNFPDALRFSKLVKKKFNSIPQILGGIHATLYPEEILKNCKSFDYIILGEGEETIIKLIDCLKYKKSLSYVNGIAFRNKNKIHVNLKSSFIKNIDKIPFPNYELINFEDYYIDTSNYYNPKKQDFKTSIPIITSRSCPNRCPFCCMWQVMGTIWRERSAKNVVDEIEILYKKYKQRHFSIMDDNFTLNKKRIIEICNEINKRSLDIQIETPNGLSINTLDEEILDAMVSAGLIRISLAVESGSDYIRNKIMKKNLSKEKIIEVFNLIKRKYPLLFVNAFFIIGMPEETEETLEDTYNMIKELNPDKTILMNIVPFPKTELFEQALKDKLFIDFKTKKLFLDSNRYFTNYDRFFIKPYNLSINKLKDFRLKVKKWFEQPDIYNLNSKSLFSICLNDQSYIKI
jgi:anaerobic magnesium-protoporphyrin IX monomethyl ester cyclase